MKVPCVNCIYATEDRKASVGSWTAYECSNPESMFYLALLNVTKCGKKLRQITWSGCDKGKRRDEGETVFKPSL